MNNNKDKTLTASDVITYISDSMQKDMTAFQNGAAAHSGYANIDSLTDMYPGLYVIGAISSLGKTTFIHQMADQMASDGEHVIYFSLEQNTLELVSKSLSRTMAKADASTALTSLQIRKHGNDDRVAEAAREYTQGISGGRLTIVECNYRTTMDDIEEYVSGYMEQYGVRPVVIVDYLQVIRAPEGCHAGTKEIVDMHVERLKALQNQTGIVLIVISALNRQNYMSQVDFESFKESGGIEYGCDCLWALQLQELHNDIFNKPGAVNEKREIIRNAKAANPRKIELVCLKNRFGISSYCCRFLYYPQFDLFVPADGCPA